MWASISPARSRKVGGDGSDQILQSEPFLKRLLSFSPFLDLTTQDGIGGHQLRSAFRHTPFQVLMRLAQPSFSTLPFGYFCGQLPVDPFQLATPGPDGPGEERVRPPDEETDE